MGLNRITLLAIIVQGEGKKALGNNTHTMSEAKSDMSQSDAVSDRYKLMQNSFVVCVHAVLTGNNNTADFSAFFWVCGTQNDLDEILILLLHVQKGVCGLSKTVLKKEHSRCPKTT